MGIKELVDHDDDEGDDDNADDADGARRRNLIHCFKLAAAVWAKPPTIYIYIYVCKYTYLYIYVDAVLRLNVLV